MIVRWLRIALAVVVGLIAGFLTAYIASFILIRRILYPGMEGQLELTFNQNARVMAGVLALAIVAVCVVLGPTLTVRWTRRRWPSGARD